MWIKSKYREEGGKSLFSHSGFVISVIKCKFIYLLDSGNASQCHVSLSFSLIDILMNNLVARGTEKVGDTCLSLLRFVETQNLFTTF